MAPILVLGIGNILLRDEGIGVRAVEALSAGDWPDTIELADGGTGGTNLVELIAGRRKVIVIDAMDAGAEPGTILRLTPDQLAPADRPHYSVHEFGLLETLQFAERLGCAPTEVVVLGVQPATLESGLELSPELAAAIPRIIEAVRRELEATAPTASPGETTQSSP